MSLSLSSFPRHDDKFRHLPDIDRDSPDTFETPDVATDSAALEDQHLALGYDTTAVPDVAPTSVDHDNDDQGLVQSRLPLDHAKSRFRAAGVDPTPSGAFRTYDRSKYDALLRARTAAESPLQRLARLKAEALELEEQLQAGIHAQDVSASASSPNPKYADAFAQLSVLTQSLDHLTSAARPNNAGATTGLGDSLDTAGGGAGGVTAARLLDHIKAFRDSAAATSPPATYRQLAGNDYTSAATTGDNANANAITYEVYYTPDSATLIRSTKLADLDARLHALEKLLGHHVEPDLVPSEPLVGMLARIDRHLHYLANPRNLDALTRQLRAVNDQMAAAARHATPGATGVDALDGDLAAKLAALYSLVHKLDPLLPVIPRVLERLQSLQSLHAEAAQVTGAVRRSVLDVARTERSLRDVTAAVQRLQDSVTENAQVTAANVEALEKRVQDVMRRVELL